MQLNDWQLAERAGMVILLPVLILMFGIISALVSISLRIKVLTDVLKEKR